MSVRSVGPASQTTALSCQKCKKTAEKILTCGRCVLAKYCSQECQKADWTLHKIVCKTPAQRAEKASTVLRENQELINSPKFLEALAPIGLALKTSEYYGAESGIRRMIETNPDKEILLQLIDKVFPQKTCEKKLKKVWKELSPDDRRSRIQKYNEICQIFQKQEEQRALRRNLIKVPMQVIKNTAQAISNLPQPPNSNLTSDVTLLRQAANIVVEVLPRIEACPDVEMIITYSTRAVSGIVLEKDLDLLWSKLPAQEAALRKQAWLKIAPYHEAFVKALEFLQKQAYNQFMSKP
jgi:hypothetical protein